MDSDNHSQALPLEPEDPPVIDDYQVKKSALVFRAINHKLRQNIILFIHEKKKIDVTPIYVGLRIEQSVASQHLAILRNAKLVYTERQGKFIYYRINYSRLQLINDVIEKLRVS